MPLKNLLLHLHNSPAMQQNSLLLLTPLSSLLPSCLFLFIQFRLSNWGHSYVSRSLQSRHVSTTSKLCCYSDRNSFCQPVLPNFSRQCNYTSNCTSSSALVLPTPMVPMGQQLQNNQAVQPHLSDSSWCRDFPFRTTTNMKMQQRMVFMVQEEYLLECLYRSWYSLCLSKWAKEGAQLAEYNINVQHFSRCK